MLFIFLYKYLTLKKSDQSDQSGQSGQSGLSEKNRKPTTFKIVRHCRINSGLSRTLVAYTFIKPCTVLKKKEKKKKKEIDYNNLLKNVSEQLCSLKSLDSLQLTLSQRSSIKIRTIQRILASLINIKNLRFDLQLENLIKPCDESKLLSFLVEGLQKLSNLDRYTIRPSPIRVTDSEKSKIINYLSQLQGLKHELYFDRFYKPKLVKIEVSKNGGWN